MAGIKRSWEGKPLRIPSSKESAPAHFSTTAMAAAESDRPPTAIQSIFSTFRDELDQHHDRRERIIKASRDITALSKKVLVLSYH